MPSPLGHAMAGAITAWAAEAWQNRAATAGNSTVSVPVEPARRSFADRLGDALSPLTVACAVLAVAPDFDVFLHTHRTYSHSLGAAAIVWAVVAVIAWRLRLPVVRTASVCAAAYASHVLLDWLSRDNGGLMALWPLSTQDYRSGLDVFLEFTVLTHRPWNIVPVLATNLQTLGREILIFGVPFVLMLRLRLGKGRPWALSPRPWGLSARGEPKPKVPEGLRSKA